MNKDSGSSVKDVVEETDGSAKLSPGPELNNSIVDEVAD